MKTIKINLSSRLKEIEIVPLADLHLGDAQCDIEDIKKNIEYIRTHENVYTLLDGDIVNNATRRSVSDVYSEELSPMQQLNVAYELFKPIKDKILCIVNGNHEERTYRESGIGLMEILAKEFGIEDRYASESAVLFIKIGENKRREKDIRGHQFLYSMYVTHGFGMGKKAGSKLNSLVDLASVVDTQIYVTGHTHMPAVIRERFFRTDLMHCSVIPVEKMFVNLSAHLDYGGYGERFGFKPASKISPHIFLSGTEEKFWTNI